MIVFQCSRCAQRLQTPGGRYARCPLCRHVMAVPSSERERSPILATLPGPASNLARIGHRSSVALKRSVDSGEPGRPDGGTGRYLVVGELARGGMGAVLRVFDVDIRRDIAVKYLINQNDARKKARFIEETQIAGQLEHPNIVPIHDFGVDARNRLFFSMKLVKGRSLAQIIEAQRRPPKTGNSSWSLRQLLQVLVSVCHAVAYAHSRGVIHRDLKPGNVMVGDFGEVYVMDWGLAKVLGSATHDEMGGTAAQAPNEVPENHAHDATVDGTIMGTLAYMPPEQAKGQVAALDQRSDVYSLGAILYEILTLQPPVRGEGGFRAVLLRVIKSEIAPPARLAPDRFRAGQIPAELAAIAMKALAKDPDARYQDVEALRRDIELFLEGRAVSAKEDSVWETFRKIVKRNKGMSIAASIGLLLLGIVISLSLAVNYQARLRAESAYNDYLKEHEAKRLAMKTSVPAFLGAANHALEQDQLEEALALTNIALEYDPESSEATLAKGQVLTARCEFPKAREVLGKHLAARPKEDRVRELLQLLENAQPNDSASLTRLIEAFTQRGDTILADGMRRAREKARQSNRGKAAPH